ncbi:Restriction endonuclease [Neorhizobium galegae bv. orientalis]|nr:restriction endonuclease [Neorhizobium galegae]CDZ55857.1 Restriction endonuclease [Neorhizobium galegae bv. orientalis]
MQIFSYEDCASQGLIVDAVYEGETGGRLSGEALSRLLPGVGNQGGFRPSGRGEDKKFVALFTSGQDKDWPDTLDLSTGQFVYYGDNKHPGHELHDTQRSGNLILRRVFSLLHASPPQRSLVPPFFVFKKHPTAVSARSFQFKGLAVPGFVGLPPTADLVAVWKTTGGQRFQNYRAVFTVLDAAIIARDWIADLAEGRSLTASAPAAWVEWVERGRYRALTSESTTVIRSVASQLPETPLKASILETIWKHFAAAPFAFEAFAARIFQMYDPRVVIDEITRGSIDGGRDAIGRYRIGLIDDPVYAEFSLEAKCYRPANGNDSANTVGVKEVARLISRIRHREFGVLVTTSAVARQAYQEVREDRHPIIFLCGRDIVDILSVNGFNTPQLVSDLLNNEFAVAGGA